jgi:hypothetical protein
VTIEGSATIGAGAFQDCYSLTTVNLPLVTKIVRGVFAGCRSLTNVTLPEVRTVESHAFDGCTSLTEVAMPETRTVESHAFDGCTSLTEVGRSLKTMGPPEVEEGGLGRSLTTMRQLATTNLNEVIFNFQLRL